MPPVPASSSSLDPLTERPVQPEPASVPARGGVFRWVPIRSLAERYRKRITTHLIALPPGDRYLRFGHTASDEQIANYVTGIDFDRDEVFGIFNRRLELVAVAHLAYERPPQLSSRPAMVEFGVSVLPQARGRGYGARLFEHAVMHARNRSTETLFIHALSENTAMLKIARNAGAKVVRDGSESEAWLTLPPDTLASQVEEMVETYAAEVNHRIMRHAMRLEHLFDAVNEVRAQFAKGAHVASE
ncbi:GNAT family N-acetyltransferase [Methylibium sp.]|uniref:GNAT family N-acetyltransferase n=1 Tax=Methylibium sp. TaxID=2067992 RepID=UPI003D0CB19D